MRNSRLFSAWETILCAEKDAGMKTKKQTSKRASRDTVASRRNFMRQAVLGGAGATAAALGTGAKTPSRSLSQASSKAQSVHRYPVSIFR